MTDLFETKSKPIPITKEMVSNPISKLEATKEVQG